MQNVIEKQTELKAPISKVWKALTDYRQFGTWFGVQLEAPFIPGQVSKGQLTIPGYEHIQIEFEVVKIEPENYFSYNWNPYAVDPKIDYAKEKKTLVEFRLEKVPNGTKLTVKESGFEDIPKARQFDAFRMNEEGWGIQMKNIRKYCDKYENS